MLGAKLSLHDISDVEEFCSQIIHCSRIELTLTYHEREDLTTELIEACWILSERYDPAGFPSFYTWALRILRLRVFLGLACLIAGMFILVEQARAHNLPGTEHNRRHAITHAFCGSLRPCPMGEKALQVAYCESGPNLWPYARNGSHLGLFQVDSLWRSEIAGWSWSPWLRPAMPTGSGFVPAGGRGTVPSYAPSPPWTLHCLHCPHCAWYVVVNARGAHGKDPGSGVAAARVLRDHIVSWHRAYA